MIVKKNRAISRLPASAILNCEDRKKFSAFVALIVAVNKRINPDEYIAPRRARSKKKIIECNLENLYKEGSQKSGPCLLLITHALSLLQLFKNLSSGKAYDRYRSINSQPEFIPNY